MDDNDEDEWPLTFKEGVAWGHYESYTQAQQAFDKGEIELWLEACQPKSLGDWIAWEFNHPCPEENCSGHVYHNGAHRALKEKDETA